MGALTAPSETTANSAISISAELCETTATVSPRFTPSEARPAATARRRSSSWPQVRSTHLPDAVRERTAARFGSAAARAAISSPSERKDDSGSGIPPPTSSASDGIRESSVMGASLLLCRDLFLAELLDHLLLRRAGNRLVLGEFHGEFTLALRRRAQIGGVPE